MCAKAGTALIGYSPLGAGFLTGKYRAGIVPDSRFARIPGHQPLYLNDTATARLAQLEQAARESGLSLVALALAWALHDPEIDTVLVGGRNCHQLDQAFAARSPAAQGALAHLNRISTA
jgi:aryl-alcohol dehydrogenase-like predicted oxidoreductase